MKDKIKDKILEPKDYADIKYNIPYVFKLNKGKQSFVYFGIEHSNDPKRDQLVKLETEYTEWLEKSKGDRIVVTEFTAPEESEERDILIREYGEAGLMKYLTNKDSVEIMSVEPNPSELTEYLINDKKYDKEDLVLWILANSIFHTKDVDGVIDSVDKLNEKFGANKDSEYYKSRFFEITGEKLDIKSVKKAQNPFSSKTLLNQIGSYINSVKDILVAERLLKLLDSKKSVFAVYGHNHVFAQEAAFEIYFK